MKLDTESRRLSLNPRDPAFYQDPYPTYRRLQQEAPVVYWEEFERWRFLRHTGTSPPSCATADSVAAWRISRESRPANRC
ncbi:MAG: hypothetical protein GY719_31665 [bacterium]|nr:hypothetical protein [bacterium]